MVVRASLAVAAVLIGCGGKVTNNPEASHSTTEAAATGNYGAGGAGGSIGGAGLSSATGGVVTGGVGGTLTKANGETTGGTAGATGGVFGGGRATFAGGTVGMDSRGNGGTSPGGAGGGVLAGGAGGLAGASEISGSSGADGDAGTDVVCTESATLCAGGDGITDGICYARECKGYLYSDSYSTFQSGSPCPADLMQAVGSDCKPEGTMCHAKYHEFRCSQVDSSYCYTDSYELSPDGGHIYMPVCSVPLYGFYRCVTGGFCQEWFEGGCSTLFSCSGGQWTLVSHSCYA